MRFVSFFGHGLSYGRGAADKRRDDNDTKAPPAVALALRKLSLSAV